MNTETNHQKLSIKDRIGKKKFLAKKKFTSKEITADEEKSIGKRIQLLKNAKNKHGQGNLTKVANQQIKITRTVNSARGRISIQNKNLVARGGKVFHNKRNVSLNNKKLKTFNGTKQLQTKTFRNVGLKRAPQNVSVSNRKVEFDDRDVLEGNIAQDNFMGVVNYSIENVSNFPNPTQLPIPPVNAQFFPPVHDNIMEMNNINTLRETDIQKERDYKEEFRAMEIKRIEYEEKLRAIERKRVEEMMFREEQRRFEEEQKRFENEQREIDKERMHLDLLRRTLEKEKRDLEILKKSVEEEEERERNMSKGREMNNDYVGGFGTNNNILNQENRMAGAGLLDFMLNNNSTSSGEARGRNSSFRGKGRGGNYSSRGRGRGGNSSSRGGEWEFPNTRSEGQVRGGMERKNLNWSSKFDETERDYITRDSSPTSNRMGVTSSLMNYMDQKSTDAPSRIRGDNFNQYDNYQNTFGDASGGQGYNYCGGNITSEYSQRESYRKNENILNQNRDYNVHTESGFEILSRGFKPINEDANYNQRDDYQSTSSFNTHQNSFIGHQYHDNMYDQGRKNKDFSENTGRHGSLDNRGTRKGDYYSPSSEENKFGFVGHSFRGRSPIYEKPIGSGRNRRNNQDFAEQPSQSEKSADSFYSYRPGDKGLESSSKSGNFSSGAIDILGVSTNLLNTFSKNSSSSSGQNRATSYGNSEFFGTEVRNDNIRPSSFDNSASSKDTMKKMDMGSGSDFSNVLKKLRNKKKNTQRELNFLLKKQEVAQWNSNLFPSSQVLKIEALKKRVDDLNEEISMIASRSR